MADIALTQRRRPLPRWRTPAGLTSRIDLLLGSLLLAGLAIAQQPTKTVLDTKPALALNPTYYLGQQLHLWNAAAEGGSIPNQTVGYLTPMGPFFLLTNALRIPAGIAQHLWLALLLVVAFWGCVRLADALGVGNRWSRLLAGLSYAASPWMLARIGDLSAFTIGAVLLPWVMLPLVRYTLGTSPDAPPNTRWASPRRAAAFSAIAVFLIGGANASVVLGVLLAPVLWLLLACRGRQAWTLRLWWVACVGAGVLWWVFALAVQGRYGIDFLPYTETARITTDVTSLPETLRGTSDWFDYLREGPLRSAAAWTYVTAPAAIVGSLAAAGLGLAGLTSRRLPFRRCWLLSLAIGVVVVAGAYPGAPHGVFAGGYRDLLAGALGPIRNVTKFQPLIRLPLAMGVAAALPAVTAAVQRWRPTWRRTVSATSLVLVAGAVLLAAAPLGLIRIYQDQDFAIPAYWKTAAKWLDRNATDSRTLLLPGTAFADYAWGNSRDEPLLWLSKTDWAVRDLIPLGSINGVRWLDGIDQQLMQGSAPNLAATLSRAGVGYVLVRNDLAADASDTPPSSAQVHAALASAGLERVAAFGPDVPARLSGIEQFFHLPPQDTSHPALEVYRLAGASTVDAYPASDVAVVSGGPEALTTLSGTNALGNRPTVLAADVAAGAAGRSQFPAGTPFTTWIDTDTLGRRETLYGSVHNGQLDLVPAGTRAALDPSTPQVRLDVDPTGHETVVRYTGISNVTASGSGFVLRPTALSGPGQAVDGDPSTAWSVAGFAKDNVGQWLQLSFGRPRDPGYVDVSLLGQNERITAFKVTTDAGSRVVQLRDTTEPQRVPLPAGETTSIRLEIAGTQRLRSQLASVGITSVTVPGVTITRQVVLPDDWRTVFASPPTSVAYVFSRERGDPRSELSVDAEHQLVRRFDVPATAQFYASGTVTFPSGAVPAEAGTGEAVNLACGAGPTVLVDGKPYQTYVAGTRRAITSGTPVPLGLCLDRPLTLARGSHVLQTVAGSSSALVAGFTLTTKLTPPVAARSTTVQSWGLEHRSIRMSAGPASVVTTHENFSRTWTASANGKPLQAVQLDGWQQGFVVPAGEAVTIELTNKPGVLWRKGLVVGAAAVVLLFLVAFIPARRRARVSRPAAPRAYGSKAIRVATLGLAVGTTLLTAGAVVAACVPLLALVLWRFRRLLPILVLGATAATIGLGVADIVRYPSAQSGVFSPAAQVLVALAIAAVVLAPGAGGRQEGGEPTEPELPGADAADASAPEPDAAEPLRRDELVPAGAPHAGHP